MVEGATVLVTSGYFKVSVTEDEPQASFARRSPLAAETPVDSWDSRGPRRVVVEHYWALACLPQRALLGGLWTPNARGALRVEVVPSGAGDHGPTSFVGELGRPLAPGLPDEYGPAVLRALTTSGLPSGDLTVDRAAHDPVESSPFAFGAAARLLAAVLAVDEARMVEAVERCMADLRAEIRRPGVADRS